MYRAIEYFYHINPTNMINNRNNITFIYNGYNYLLVECNISDKELHNVFRYSNELRKKGFNCHIIVNNIYQELLTVINGKRMVLLKIIQNDNSLIDIFDIIRIEREFILNETIIKRHQNNWGVLWQKKIDYLEKQMDSFGLNKNAVINSFSYYIGMAENAIVYYNNAVNGVPVSSKLCLNHRRIFFPNVWLNYGNPLSFVIDVPQRDEAEYLKYLFFYGQKKEAYESFTDLIKIKKMNSYDAQLLLARMLFPSYYFDVCECVLIDNEREERIINILNKRKSYEEFLKSCYMELSNNLSINRLPEWLL